MDITEKLLELSAKVMLTTDRKERIALSAELTALASNAVASTKEDKISTGILAFSQKEITKMPKPFNRLFRIKKIVAHVRKKPNNVYEIRLCHEGNYYFASSINLATAKEKFIVALNNQNSIAKKKINPCDEKFSEFANMWLEIVKKPFIKDNTYDEYLAVLQKDLYPKFGERKLVDIRTSEIQAFINEYIFAGKNRTAKKCRQQLSAIFEYAVAEKLIDKSPTSATKLLPYKQKKGVALTIAEEKAFIDKLFASEAPSKYAVALMLFTGIRRGELKTAIIDKQNKWVTVVNGKQRKKQNADEETRKIPISPQCLKYLMLNEDFLSFSETTLTKIVNNISPNNRLHDLRHTFITRCQERMIARELVSVWAGHAADNSMTSRVYTHFSDEFQQSEILKLDY